MDFLKIKENWICRKWIENGFFENYNNFYIYVVVRIIINQEDICNFVFISLKYIK